MKFNLSNDLNKGIKRFDYEMNDKHEYKTLEELYKADKEKIYIVRMFYTNKKSKFGDNEVVVTDDFIINLPKHLTEIVADIIANEEHFKSIENGKFAFNIYEYEYSQGKQVKNAYSVNWGTIE